MLLTEYVAKGHVTFAKLMRLSGCAMRTVHKAAKYGEGVTYETAEKLSRATHGLCSIDEIRFPDKYRDARRSAQ